MTSWICPVESRWVQKVLKEDMQLIELKGIKLFFTGCRHNPLRIKFRTTVTFHVFFPQEN